MAKLDVVATAFIEMAHRIVWCSAATIDTEGSGFDTVLAVYTGTNVALLTPVAYSDDSSTSAMLPLGKSVAPSGTPTCSNVSG